MAFCLPLFLTGCFSTKAAWHPYGERATVSAITLVVDAATVGHGRTSTVLVEGGSSFYTCSIVSGGGNQGTVTFSYVSSSRGKCVYTAPNSGSSVNPVVRITDEKYPEKYSETTLYVPPSGEPDPSYGSNAVSGLPGTLISFASRDTVVTGFDTDRDGRVLISGLAKGSSALDDLGFVARLKTTGELDAAFGTGGIYTWGPAPHCGTGGGSEIINVSVKAENDGNGVRLAYEKGNSFLVRLDEAGQLDTSWGKPVGASVITTGCTMMNDLIMGSTYTMKSFELDSHDNTLFGYVSGSVMFLTKINGQGNAHITSSPAIAAPTDYVHDAIPVPIFFSKGDRNFIAVHAKRSASVEYGFMITEFDSSGTNVFAKTGNGFPNGRVFIPTQHPAATVPAAQQVIGTSFQMDANGVIHVGAHSYFDDLGPYNGDAGFYFHYATSGWDTLSPHGSSGRANDLLTNQFTENFLTPPISSSSAIFDAAVTTDFVLGSYAGLLQANGGFLVLGANTSDNFSSLAQATAGRFLPGGGSDSAFRGARSGESDVQVPLVNLTVVPGYNSAFYRGTLDSDGKYITAGHFKVSGQQNKVWAARFWP